MQKVTNEQIIESAKNNQTMAQAAAELGIHFNTFKYRATKLGVYVPNQSGKGISKPRTDKIPLSEILDGKHPQYQTFKLKLRLYSEGLKENKCEECGLTEWNGKPIQCELDHIDGDRTNHSLDNLKILCPNCHSQTPTFRAKNI